MDLQVREQTHVHQHDVAATVSCAATQPFDMLAAVRRTIVNNASFCQQPGIWTSLLLLHHCPQLRMFILTACWACSAVTVVF